MKCYGRRLNTAIVTVLIAGAAAFGGSPKKDARPAGFISYSDGCIEDIRIDTNSVALIKTVRSCTLFVDLKKNLPKIATCLEKMMREKDVEGVMQAYEGMGYQVHDILVKTGIRNNSYYEDDLMALGRQLDSASSKKEALTWVFLSLPRLFDRASMMIYPDDMNDLKRAGEDYFFKRLRASPRLPVGIEGALKRYWYKDNGMPAAEDDQRAFLSYFVTLF